MTRSRSFALLALAGVASFITYFGYLFMTDLEQNRFCRVMEPSQFAELQSDMAQFAMQVSKTGIDVVLTLDTDLPRAGMGTLFVGLGSLADPDGVEYRGPFTPQISTRVAIPADMDQFNLVPSVRLFYPERYAVCVWEADAAIEVTHETAGPIVRRLVLHSARVDGRMGSLDIVDDG